MNYPAPNDLATAIDHTLLKPEAPQSAIENLCRQAVDYGFHAVCVNPWWVGVASELLQPYPVKVCSVVGFPLGMTPVKGREARQAVEDGADELDMVMAVGAFKSGDYSRVRHDIEDVVRCGKPVKVILETGLLTTEEIKTACHICGDAGAAFVKTSTGFSGTGATIETIKLLQAVVGNKMGIKASGGIKTLADAAAMLAAGAHRIGTSSSVQIIEELGSGDKT
jgi:deoxyribose-phosphate aldolase